jgi:hypothetical protein
MKWTEKQQQVIDSRNRNLLVSAAAGSGKTGANGQNRNHRSRCRKCSLYGSSKKNCPHKGDSGGNAKGAGRLHTASIGVSLPQEEARNNKFGNPKRSIL